MEINNHPFVPKDLHLPDYVPISLSRSTIVAAYLSVSLAKAALVWILAGRLTKISKLDRLLMCWWMFTGLTHVVLEGYFVFSPDFFKDQTGFFLAEGKSTISDEDRLGGWIGAREGWIDPRRIPGR